LFYSNELQRSHARIEPCNLPRSVLTLWVTAVSCEILIEIRKLQATLSGQLKFLATSNEAPKLMLNWQ